MYGIVDVSDDLDSFSDTEIMAKTLFGEARGSALETKQAVANVIMNRVKEPRWWGSDVRSVCLKPYQFSCWNQSDPNRPVIVAATAADPVYEQCLELASRAMAGNLPDSTGGCDSYCVVGTNPAWAQKLTPYFTSGNMNFYVTV